MNFKPTKEDILFAEKVYNDVIVTQVFNPNLIVEAYRKLTGVDTPLVNKMQARRFVFNFFYYKRHLELLDSLFDVDSEDKQEDVNTNLAKNFTIGTVENKPLQSHLEDGELNVYCNEDGSIAGAVAKDDKGDVHIIGKPKEECPLQSHSEDDDFITDTEIEIAALEEKYAQAEDANEKRSIKYKINQLKKQK